MNQNILNQKHKFIFELGLFVKKLAMMFAQFQSKAPCELPEICCFVLLYFEHIFTLNMVLSKKNNLPTHIPFSRR